MHWFWWLLAGWLALGSLLMVLLIGEPRKPITSGQAITSIIINAVLIYGILALNDIHL